MFHSSRHGAVATRYIPTSSATVLHPSLYFDSGLATSFFFLLGIHSAQPCDPLPLRDRPVIRTATMSDFQLFLCFICPRINHHSLRLSGPDKSLSFHFGTRKPQPHDSTILKKKHCAVCHQVSLIETYFIGRPRESTFKTYQPFTTLTGLSNHIFLYLQGTGDNVLVPTKQRLHS